MTDIYPRDNRKNLKHREATVMRKTRLIFIVAIIALLAVGGA